MTFCTHICSNWPPSLTKKKSKNCVTWGSLLTFDFGMNLENQNYPNQIYRVFRLGKPFNLTYWSIKFEDLHADLQNPIRVPTKVLVLSRRIKICNNILTFWPFSRSKGHKCQGWRPFWMFIFVFFVFYCSINHFRCIQHAVCQIFCFYHQILHFPWNLTQICWTTSTTSVYSR